MPQSPTGIETSNGPEGSIFLPKERTLTEIASEMFELFQDRGAARGMGLEEKLAIARVLDEQKARILGEQGLTLVAHSL